MGHALGDDGVWMKGALEQGQEGLGGAAAGKGVVGGRAGRRRVEAGHGAPEVQAEEDRKARHGAAELVATDEAGHAGLEGEPQVRFVEDHLRRIAEEP